MYDIQKSCDLYKMADAQEGKVALEIDGNIAIISFNRGQNRLCLPFFDQLNKALDDIERWVNLFLRILANFNLIVFVQSLY